MRFQEITTNRKAKFDFSFLRTLNAGIQLVGSEIKAIRAHKISLVDAFCLFDGNELFLKNAKITEDGTQHSHRSERERKLLLKRSELDKLQRDLVKGLTLVPYRVFINDHGYAKVEIALAKGKNNYDKRETLKKREADLEMQRVKK